MSKTSDLIERVRRDIRSRKRQLVQHRRAGKETSEALQQRQIDIETLIDKYSTISAGQAYFDTVEEQAFDLCDELFYELDNGSRSLLNLSRFYEKGSVMTIIGENKYEGGDVIAGSIMVTINKHLYMAEAIQSCLLLYSQPFYFA